MCVVHFCSYNIHGRTYTFCGPIRRSSNGQVDLDTLLLGFSASSLDHTALSEVLEHLPSLPFIAPSRAPLKQNKTWTRSMCCHTAGLVYAQTERHRPTNSQLKLLSRRLDEQRRLPPVLFLQGFGHTFDNRRRIAYMLRCIPLHLA